MKNTDLQRHIKYLIIGNNQVDLKRMRSHFALIVQTKKATMKSHPIQPKGWPGKLMYGLDVARLKILCILIYCFLQK